jgi:hypothetical protein
MTESHVQDPQTAAVALAAIRDAIERRRPLLAAAAAPELTAAMIDTASATSEFTAILLQLSHGFRRVPAGDRDA